MGRFLPGGGPSLREFGMGTVIGMGIGFIPVMVISYLVETQYLPDLPLAGVYAIFIVPQLAGGLVSAYLAASRSTRNHFVFGFLAGVASMFLYLFMGTAIFGFVGGSLALLAYIVGGTAGALMRMIRIGFRRKQ